MAYDFNAEKREDVAAIEVNDHGEYIKVAEITKPNGDKVVDVRLWYTPEEGGGLSPTKKGLRISAENLQQVAVTLMGLCEDSEGLFTQFAMNLMAGSETKEGLVDLLDEAETALEECGDEDGDEDGEFGAEDYAGIEGEQ